MKIAFTLELSEKTLEAFAEVHDTENGEDVKEVLVEALTEFIDDVKAEAAEDGQS